MVYRICHGKGLHLFSGSKNQGCVQSGSSVCGLYKPSSNNHNFAVPNKKSLRNSSEDLPSIILCRIIEESFQLLDINKQYVISIDGKKIATGLAKDDIGNMNLWGFEEPSIELRKERKENDLELVATFKEAIDTCSFDRILTNCQKYCQCFMDIYRILGKLNWATKTYCNVFSNYHRIVQITRKITHLA